MARIWIGLGSNYGDRWGNLHKAIEKLGQCIDNISFSSVYESEALLPHGATEDWNRPFLNMVIAGEIHIAPQEALHWLKAVEQQVGRKARGFWGPREIDLDILLYGNLIIESEDLIVPHKHMLERDFVMIPLVEVAQGVPHPVTGELLSDMLYKSGMQEKAKLRKEYRTIK